MALLLAVGAAFSNAMTTILQRMGLESAPAEDSLSFRLLAHAIKRKVWLLGVLAMLCSAAFQAFALHIGQLSVVQPALTLELPLMVAIVTIFFHGRPGWHDWAASCASAIGLAAFLIIASPTGGGRVPTLREWAITALIICLGSAGALGISMNGSPARRATSLGASASLLFALTAALLKEVTIQLANSWTSVFTNWQLYALAATAAAALFLTQSAFHAGPIGASQTTLVVIDPLASIAIGIYLFGDRIRADGIRAFGEIAAMAVLLIAGVVLARSPLVAIYRAGAVAEVGGTDPVQSPGEAT